VALIAKLAIAPPVEVVVKPVAAVFTVRVSAALESEKTGAAVVTVNVKVAVALPAAFVAVIV
jgi:hypothetical protein